MEVFQSLRVFYAAIIKSGSSILKEMLSSTKYQHGAHETLTRPGTLETLKWEDVFIVDNEAA